MLRASVFDLTYCRVLTENLSVEQGEALIKNFDYSFVVCYDACDSPAFETIQKHACVIDLSEGVDAAFARFHATSRNEVRRSEKIAGLEFRFGTGTDFDTYFSFYKTCENARNWFPVPEDELRNSLVFSAYFDEQPISGMNFYTHEGRMRVGRIYSLKRLNKDPRLNNLLFGCAAKRIVFELCQYGAESGFHTLDLGGVDMKDAGKSGISRFKLSLGGEIEAVTIARYRSSRFQAQEQRIREAGYDIT